MLSLGHDFRVVSHVCDLRMVSFGYDFRMMSPGADFRMVSLGLTGPCPEEGYIVI